MAFVPITKAESCVEIMLWKNPPDPEDVARETARILARMREYEAGPKIDWQVGDAFKVMDGPFMGLHGKIIEVHQEREGLMTSIKLFGRETPVELHPMDIEKL